MNKQVYVEENFRFVEEMDSEYKCKVRIFTRKNGIGDIPQDLKSYIYSVYPIYSKGDIHWTKGNCDKGVFDAVLVIHSSKTCVDVYICGILRRPFTIEDQEEYEDYFVNDIDYRLTKSFDNHQK